MRMRMISKTKAADSLRKMRRVARSLEVVMRRLAQRKLMLP